MRTRAEARILEKKNVQNGKRMSSLVQRIAVSNRFLYEFTEHRNIRRRSPGSRPKMARQRDDSQTTNRRWEDGSGEFSSNWAFWVSLFDARPATDSAVSTPDGRVSGRRARATLRCQPPTLTGASLLPEIFHE